MPQLNYEMPELLLGQIGDASPVRLDSYVNELLEQLSTLTLSGNGAGTYTVLIEGNNQSFTGTFVAGAPDAVTAIIDGLIAAFEVDGLLGTAVMTNADPDLDFDFLHTGIPYVLTILSNPGCVMSLATSQAAGGTNFPLGLCLAQSAAGDDVARVPTSDTDVLLGLSVRNIEIETNIGGSGETETEPGDTFSLMLEGDTVVFATTAVAAGGPVFVRHANGTAAAPLGSMSATDDGETVLLPGTRFKTTIAAAGLVRVTCNIPG